MDHRVEGFPFNVLENPMYVGSTLCFLATALWYIHFLLNLDDVLTLSFAGMKSPLAS